MSLLPTHAHALRAVANSAQVFVEVYRKQRAPGALQWFTLGLVDSMGEFKVWSASYDVMRTMPVEELKGRISRAAGERGTLYLVKQFWLKEKKVTKLESGTLADYNISNRSMLHFKLHRMNSC